MSILRNTGGTDFERSWFVKFHTSRYTKNVAIIEKNWTLDAMFFLMPPL